MPKRLTLRQQLMIAQANEESGRSLIATQIEKIKLLEMKVAYMGVTERRMDQLLEIMNNGAKEGRFPRSSS